MAKKDRLTSEDKLLKIIENPSGSKEKGLFKFKGRPSYRGRGRGFNLASLWEGKKLGDLLQPKVLNKTLAVFCLVLTLFGVLYFFHRKIVSERRLGRIEAGRNGLVREKEERPYLIVSLDESLSEAKVRNIFSFLPMEEEKEEAEEDAFSEDMTAIFENIKLVGIIWSETKPEVMIERVKEKQTLLLGEGDKIGEITIKEIYRDMVILEAEDKEYELR
jgi:hypothetical protein